MGIIFLVGKIQLYLKYKGTFLCPASRKWEYIKSHSSVRPSVCHKNFHLIHIFFNIRGRVFIFLIYIHCDVAFVHSKLYHLFNFEHDLWLTYLKILTFAITFIGFLYFTCTRPFRPCQNVWPLPWLLTYISENYNICHRVGLVGWLVGCDVPS